MKRILVTGGAGFIGSRIAKELAETNFQVDLLDNFSRGVLDPELRELSNHKNINLIEGDLLKTETYGKLSTEYHHIYHMAAIIGVSHVLQRPYAVLTDNISMLTSMLDFGKRQKSLDRFVFASTSEVYAGTLQYFTLPIPTPENTPLTISDLTHPRTSYMLSKIYGEALCHQSGLPFMIVRPHNIYGPRMGMSHVVPELLKKGYDAQRGAEIEIASMEHRRAFCYIEDGVQEIIKATQVPSCRNETLNIGNDEIEISIGDLAGEIFNILDKNLIAKSAKESPGSPSRRCPDISKVVKLTEFKPKVPLKEGLRLTYNWYVENIFKSTSKGAQ